MLAAQVIWAARFYAMRQHSVEFPVVTDLKQLAMLWAHYQNGVNAPAIRETAERQWQPLLESGDKEAVATARRDLPFLFGGR